MPKRELVDLRSHEYLARELDRVKADRDRYAAALERIAKDVNDDGSLPWATRKAREALNP